MHNISFYEQRSAMDNRAGEQKYQAGLSFYLDAVILVVARSLFRVHPGLRAPLWFRRWR
jgi:hypothetical protein